MADDARLQVVLEAKIDKLIERLNTSNRAVYGASAKMQKDLDAANGKWERMFLGKGPGKALDDVFSRSRFALIEQGGARIGIFGSALEKLGPAGLLGAAGIAAFALAMDQTRRAIEFADTLDDTAKRLHVTTDALQEYRYAVRLAGGEEKGADEALENFSVTLGKAQAGLPKALKGFQMLGFTKDQVKSFTDADVALKAVTARIEGLGKVQQKDAIVSQLGLDGLKPLIEDGVEAMTRLRQEAHNVGVVMDAELVKRGAEAKDTYETLAKVVDVQLKSAFVDLAPVLIGLMGLIGDMVRGIADMIASFQVIENRATTALKDRRATVVKELDILVAAGGRGEGVSKVAIQSKQDEVARIDAELDKRAAQIKLDTPAAPKPGGADLIDLQGNKDADAAAKAAKDRARRGAEAVARAVEDELSARAALVTGLQEQADLQVQQIDAELKRKNDRLTAQAADHDISDADAKRAIELNEAAAASERVKVARETEARVAEDIIATVTNIAGYYSEIEGIEAGMATSARQRREIELRRLANAERVERQEMETRHRLEREGKSGPDLEQVNNQQSAEVGAFNDRSAARRAGVNFNTRGPIEAYIDSLQNLDDVIQNEAISAFRGLADSLGDTTAKLLGLKGPFGQFIGQLLSLQFQKSGAGLLGLLDKIPGFAGGTNFAPGGLSLVGERGPELVNLPRGAQVIPSELLRQMSDIRPNGGAGRLDYHMHIDLTGANGDQTIKEIAYDAAMQGATAAYSMASRDIPMRMAARAANRLGG